MIVVLWASCIANAVVGIDSCKVQVSSCTIAVIAVVSLDLYLYICFRMQAILNLGLAVIAITFGALQFVL